MFKLSEDFLPRARRDQALFGFECGEGWYRLIDATCALIQVDVSTGHQQFVATQVKEKFGGLRFYYRDGCDYAASVITLVESLSLHVCEICRALGKGVSEKRDVFTQNFLDPIRRKFYF